MASTAAEFGADPTGVRDSTGAFLKAAASCRRLYCPGNYRVSSAITLNQPIEICGDYGTSTITTTSPNADIFDINSGNVAIHDLMFASAVPRTGGQYILAAAGSWIKLYRLFMNAPVVGITVGPAFSAIIDISDIYIYDTVGIIGTGIVVLGGYAVRIRHTQMNSGASPQPNAGINIVNCGDCVLDDLNIIQHGRDLLVNPGQGQQVDSLYATNSMFDTSSGSGLLVQPSGTGVVGGAVQRSSFIGCWFSSHGASGVEFTGSSGVTNGFDFIGCHAYGNAVDGFTLGYGSDFTLTSNRAGGNAGAGLSIASGISDVIAGHNTFKPTGGFGPNGYGVFIADGPGDNLIITPNALRGNTTASFVNGATGANVILAPNLI